MIITVDAPPGVLPDGFEQKMIGAWPQLNITFKYYNEVQFRIAKALKLPYIYAWLSWCIAMASCRTQTALLHDYDALVLGDTLPGRYREFVASDASIQGIRWYQGNGIEMDDRLATTFEALIDVTWFRQFPPIKMLNQLGILHGRSVDFDVCLEAQARSTPASKRTVVPMTLDDLVHPSQMVHQYTMFRNHPGAALPCGSMLMIPFFSHVSGDGTALSQTCQRLRSRTGQTLKFLGDECVVNFANLQTTQVDWALKQMLQVCVKRNMPPCRDLLDYGTSLYELAAAPTKQIWVGNFTDEQRSWIQASRDVKPTYYSDTE